MNEAAAAAQPPSGGARRREDTRERLLSAARALFCEQGYVAVSVETIAATAGLTRMTFYRYFPGKAALAIELYREAQAAAMPRLLSMRDRDPASREAVGGWIVELFRADRGERRLLRAFTQAAAVEPVFAERAQEMIGDMIAGLGAGLPAFAVRPDVAAERRRWLEAWLLLYEILDQSNHAALESGVAGDPQIVELLAERFGRFATSMPPSGE